jgi:hypothetical protein
MLDRQISQDKICSINPLEEVPEVSQARFQPIEYLGLFPSGTSVDRYNSLALSKDSIISSLCLILATVHLPFISVVDCC